jgi:acetyltransferase-like isoleucine patch superfamily enzyme
MAPALDTVGRLTRLIRGRLRAVWLRFRGARVGRKSQIGADVRVRLARCIVLGTNVEIEHGVYIKVVDEKAVLDIGDFSFVGTGCVLHVAQSLTIGSHSLLGAHVVISDHSHVAGRGRRTDEQGIRCAPVRIGSDVTIYPQSVVTAGVTIGDGAIISACSLVTKDVPPLSIVAGVPARVIGERSG